MMDLSTEEKREAWKDFNRIPATSQAWKEYGLDWSRQIKEDRFDPLPTSMDYKMAYFYEDYVPTMLAKQCLEKIGVKYELFSDEWSMGWVIVTDAWEGN